MGKRNYLIADRTARKGSWKKIVYSAIIVICTYRLGLDIFGEMGFVKYGRMNGQYNGLIVDIAKLKQDNDRLRKNIPLLKTDLDYIERVARDKLGLARPGEIVYYYDGR